MNETLLNVQGMTCRSCVHHVGEALRDLDGIAEVDVRLQKGQVLVRHDARTPVAKMIEALSEAGYESSTAA